MLYLLSISFLSTSWILVLIRVCRFVNTFPRIDLPLPVCNWISFSIASYIAKNDIGFITLNTIIYAGLPVKSE